VGRFDYRMRKANRRSRFKAESSKQGLRPMEERFVLDWRFEPTEYLAISSDSH